MLTEFNKRLSDEELLALAKKASEAAYCPYSDFSVGAALESDTGRVYLGANIENAAYGVALCAERVALAEGVMRGERKFKRIAVYGKKKDETENEACYPCGVCRQALSEFCGSELTVITEKGGKIESHSFSSLLPYSFRKENLK